LLCIDQNNTKGKLEYLSNESGVLVPYKACNILVRGALLMSMGRVKLHYMFKDMSKKADRDDKS
jgi:hypothetical protein